MFKGRLSRVRYGSNIGFMEVMVRIYPRMQLVFCGQGKRTSGGFRVLVFTMGTVSELLSLCVSMFGPVHNPNHEQIASERLV